MVAGVMTGLFLTNDAGAEVGVAEVEEEEEEVDFDRRAAQNCASAAN